MVKFLDMKNVIIVSMVLLMATACGPLKMFFHGPNYTDTEGMRQGKWIYASVQDPKRLESKGSFKNDRPGGKWKYYDSEENLLRKEKYKHKNGETRIKTTFYYPGRSVEKEGWAQVEYTEIQAHYYWVGKWNYYNEAGELIAIKYFTKGIGEPEVLWENDSNAISNQKR